MPETIHLTIAVPIAGTKDLKPPEIKANITLIFPGYPKMERVRMDYFQANFTDKMRKK